MDYWSNRTINLRAGMSDGALDPVKEYLREHSHPHLTPDVVARRATVVDDPRHPEAIVFDVEKRRQTLGARYREDLPLAAYETYWERYRFDPQTRTLLHVGTNVAEDQASTVTINSVSRLLRDHLESLRGLLDRAWP